MVSWRGKAGLLTLLIAGSVFLPALSTPLQGLPGTSPVQSEGVQGNLAVSSNFSSTTGTIPQNSTIPPPNLNPNFSCGFHSDQNSSEAVASSPEGTAVRIAVGEPSWWQICASYGHAGESFVAYEIFPVTVFAAPGTAVTLSTGQASLSPEQVQMGIRNNTIWTGFNPANPTTNSQGIALSNFTLAGAVMPFVPNDIANVSLPVVARFMNGIQAEAGLPIEFSGSESGGINVIHVLQAPGPVLFPGTMVCSAGNGIQYAYGIVYAPSAGTGAQPVPVTLSVAGTWNSGAVGPLPSIVQVTVAQPSFVLYPDQVFYFFVDENNSVAQSPAQAASNYTFAIQESVGGSSYTEPLSLSIQSATLFGSTAALPASSGAGAASQNWTYPELGLVAAAVAVALFLGVLFIRRKRPEPNKVKVAG